MVANVGRLTQIDASGGVSRLESEHEAWTTKCTFGEWQQSLGVCSQSRYTEKTFNDLLEKRISI